MKLSLKKMLRTIVARSGDTVFNRVNSAYLHLKLGLKVPKIDLAKPRGFNEKIIWLKTKYRHPNASLYADKVLVKDFVRKKIGPQYLIPTLGVYKQAGDIPFQSLPNSYIVKANHGSGWNIIVKDKRQLDELKVMNTLDSWLKQNYYVYGREYQYSKIDPAVIIEELFCPDDGADLIDYKFFCFNGNPTFVQVDMDRHTDHRRNFYNLDWERLPFTILYPPASREAKRPENLESMIEIARQLSKDFPFIRVDLYEYDHKVYFGELTFHPEGGFGPILPVEWDRKLGDLLSLPALGSPSSGEIHDSGD